MLVDSVCRLGGAMSSAQALPWHDHGVKIHCSKDEAVLTLKETWHCHQEYV